MTASKNNLGQEMSKGKSSSVEEELEECGPEPVAIICRVWPNGCFHPEICQEQCFDNDLLVNQLNKNIKQGSA